MSLVVQSLPLHVLAAKYPTSNPKFHKDWDKLEAEVKVHALHLAVKYAVLELYISHCST